MIKLEKLFLIDTVLASGLGLILIILYTVALDKVLRNSKLSNVIQLLILLIVSNLALISSYFAYYKYESNYWNTASIEMDWVVIQAISAFIRDVCFNIAHWLFAFEYFSTANIMPFIIRDE